MESITPDHPLRRLFAGLVEHAFCTEVGMCDPALTGYVADMLVDFTHVDRLHAVRNAQGKRLEQVAAMLALASEPGPTDTRDRDRRVYRSIGDYTLFWAGVYPEQIKRVHHQQSDVLLDYVSQGKRSYAIVAQLAGEDDRPPASLFRHLSEDFEGCLHGLALVRRSWEQADASPADLGGDSQF